MRAVYTGQVFGVACYLDRVLGRKKTAKLIHVAATARRPTSAGAKMLWDRTPQTTILSKIMRLALQRLHRAYRHMRSTRAEGTRGGTTEGVLFTCRRRTNMIAAKATDVTRNGIVSTRSSGPASPQTTSRIPHTASRTRTSAHPMEDRIMLRGFTLNSYGAEHAFFSRAKHDPNGLLSAADFPQSNISLDISRDVVPGPRAPSEFTAAAGAVTLL